MNDGRILAADIQYYIMGGNTLDDSLMVGYWPSLPTNPPTPYSDALHPSPPLPQVMEKMLISMDNVYNIPNLRGRGAACRANLPSNTAFRGFGVPQSLTVVESMFVDVATLLGRPTYEVVTWRPSEEPLLCQTSAPTFISDLPAHSDPGDEFVPRAVCHPLRPGVQPWHAVTLLGGLQGLHMFAWLFIFPLLPLVDCMWKRKKMLSCHYVDKNTYWSVFFLRFC